ncbi:hypothetical protein MP638_000787 [Amoeboaphelidium occidentale]|nr:hypothetical protein MP638_000787 [Amoeboaphelidium occidentale]
MDVIRQVQAASAIKKFGYITKVAENNGLSKKLVSRWVKDSSKILDTNNEATKRKLHDGRPIKYQQEESAMVEWVKSLRNMRLGANNSMMAAYIMKTFPD